tara:strand:- start:27806 stop:28768 length:963 start_codon:yes stop_codon:yes gene_type:complete
MRNLFLVLLFFGIFVGIQIALFQSDNDSEIEANFDEVISSVVQIESTDYRGGKTFGSGVIVSEDGYIITAYHLLINSQNLIVKSNEVEISTKIIGFDQFSDIAVVKVDLNNLRPIDLPEAKQLNIGKQVFAIGNPYNLGISVSSGIISATNRHFGNPYLEIIQTDASINKGNSGGALVDESGKFLGLNISIASISGGSEGVGFALPAEKVISIAEEIIKHGKVKKAWFGNFSFRNIIYKDSAGDQKRGLQVIGNDQNIKNGLKNLDIIVSVKDSEPIWSTLRDVMNSLSPGDILELIVIRDGKVIPLSLVTIERPERIQI